MTNGPTCIFRDARRVNPETSARIYSAPKDSERQEASLEQRIRALESEAASFGIRFIQDSSARASYFNEIKTMSAEILRRVYRPVSALEQLTPQEAAIAAQRLRNVILEASRIASTEMGAAAAVWMKKTGKSLPALQEYYADQNFKRPFAELGESEQNQVFLSIVEGAGRSRRWVTLATKVLGRMGEAFVLLTFAFAVYHIVTAEDHLDAALHEEGDASAGVLVGLGAAALLCGPGAVICVPVAVFVGGALGSYGMDRFYSWQKTLP